MTTCTSQQNRQNEDVMRTYQDLQEALQQIGALNTGLDNLQRQRTVILKGKRALYGKTSRATVRSYSRAWNLALADEMQRLLPREIREMIYRELWSASSDDELAPLNWSFSHLRKLVQEHCYCKFGTLEECMGHKAAPHCIKQSYVGLATAREVLEVWYRMASGSQYLWHDLLAKNLSEAKRLLNADAFDVGIKPTEVLRGLIIHLDVEEPASNPTEAQAMADQLLRITHKLKFRLHFLLFQTHVRLNLWPPICELLRPVLKAFEENGGNMRVQWNYKPAPDRVSPIEYDFIPLIRQLYAGWKDDVRGALCGDHEDERWEIWSIWDHHRDYMCEDDSDYVPPAQPVIGSLPDNSFDDGFDGFDGFDDDSQTGLGDESKTKSNDGGSYLSSNESYDSDD